MTRSWLLSLALLALPAFAADAPVREARVLVVGNSLSYVNNLPALFNGIADAQSAGTHWQADMIGAPGGSLAERWSEGVVAQELASGKWQALVLQERGGSLACLADPQASADTECAATFSAHRKFIDLARQQQMRVIVLGTWGPDAIWQRKLGRGLRRVVAGTEAEALDTGPLVRDYGKAHGVEMTIDSLHPTLDASLLVAGALYRQLSGETPQPLAFATTAPMLPPLARMESKALLSQQAQLAGDGSATSVDATRLQPLFAAVAALPIAKPGGK
jgi:hypothetical protein